MKKNLAKRIVLGLLTGAVLMSSSVAWAALVIPHSAGNFVSNIQDDPEQNNHAGTTGIAIGTSADANGNYSIAIGTNTVGESITTANGADTIAIGRDAQAGVGSSPLPNPSDAIAIGAGSRANVTEGIAIGSNASVTGTNGVAIGCGAEAKSSLSVALGKGSIATGSSNVVSVGRADSNANDGTDDGLYRKIVNVEDGTSAHDAATVGQMEAITGQVNFGDYSLNYIQNNDNLTTAVVNLDEQVKANASAIESLGNNLVKNNQDNTMSGSVTINDGGNSNNPIVMDNDGITVGTNSTHMDSTGFYAGRKNTNLDHTYDNVKAAMTEDGKLKAADGKFEVDTEGKVTASSYIIKDSNGNETNIKTALDSKANAADVYTKDQADGLLDAKANKADVYDKTEIDTLLSNNNADAIAGINQRLEKTNAKINKVGAGAAALAALHPLDYDPDDKLTFSAGMGNYAGENAAALGAFYRPNEKFMLSLGGTMGNGENMVNLGLSIGLDKANGFAKMSKRELIQEVNAVKAENEAMKDQLANADERIAKLEALVAQLVAK